MNPLTREWLRKADDDASVATGLLRRRKVPADIVCLHSQQAAEKLPNAFFQDNGISVKRTHDLVELLHSAGQVEPVLLLLENDAKALTAYAVMFQYPGASASTKEARAAAVAMRRIRKAVLALLP